MRKFSSIARLGFYGAGLSLVSLLAFVIGKEKTNADVPYSQSTYYGESNYYGQSTYYSQSTYCSGKGCDTGGDTGTDYGDGSSSGSDGGY